MASRSLGTLTLDLIAQIGGYTAGLDKAEKEAQKRAKAIENAFDTAAVGVGVAFGAIATAGAAAFAAISSGIEEAAKFQDLAEMTGGSAEGIASIAVAAKTAGVEIESVAAASNKLTKNLTGVDDESKAAGAAIAALGLNLEDFKKLGAEQRVDALTKAFANFSQEGASGLARVAVAQDLWGKSGAEQLKVMNALAEQGGRQVILTDEQIKQADEFADKQAKARAELTLYASALATQALPAITAFTGALTDTIKEVLGVGQATVDLKNNTAVADFAENAVRALGFVVDAVDGVVRAFQIVGTTIGASAAAAAAVASGEFSAAKTIASEGVKDVQAILDRPLFSAKLDKRLADAKAAASKASATTAAALPALSYTGKTGKPKKDGSAAQEAKAQLDSDLAAIKNAQRTFLDAYGNQEKLLEAMRAAGLTDEKEYYAEKQRLLNLNTQAQVQAQADTIARLEQEKATGKDAIDNQKKIAEAQYQLSKIQADAATQSKILGIQEESSYKKIASALLAARQSAQDYFDTVNQGYASQLAGFGKGAKNRDFEAALQQINEKYQQQRQTLANQRAQAELTAGGPLSASAAKQFDDQLAIINEFQSKSIESYRNYYASLDEAQKDWKNGATEALKNYADEAANTAKLTEEAFTKGFNGLEDALVEFTKTGKLNFKDLANSIIADITRIAIKQSITGPLANALSGALGSGGSLASLFGSSGGGGGGDALGAFIQMNGWKTGGFTGYGAPNDPAGIVHKGEYVVDAQTTKRMGLDKGGAIGGDTNINVLVQPGQVDRRTGYQLAGDISREQRQARRYA